MSSYDFSTLSPADFEILSRDLLNADRHWSLRAFASGPDGGVDLRQSLESGLVIAQCKHYVGSSFSDLKRACRREKANMDAVSPDQYLLITSQDLSVGRKTELKEILQPWIQDIDSIISQKDINDLLTKHPKVERNHFKLWLASTEILDRIIRSGLWERSESILEDIRDRVRLYVKTSSYDQAFDMLRRKHVVAITGSPGVGKSMLADMLSLVHWNSGWQVVNLPPNSVDQCWDALRRDEKQVFIFDDVFGSTDVVEQVGRGAGATIDAFVSRVSRDQSKRLIITTRTQILRMAEQRDEHIDRSELSARQCVVEVEDYKDMTRARILYNHLYFSSLDRAILQDFVKKRYYSEVIAHQHFTPRIIENIVLKRTHATSDDLRDSLRQALKYPALIWEPSFRETLGPLDRSIVLQLATFPVEGVSPLTLRERIETQEIDPTQYTRAIRSLEGTWIKTHAVKPEQGALTSYQDPSCRDFVLHYIDSEPSYIGRILDRVCSVGELLQLLLYANAYVAQPTARRGSTAPRSPKYPGLRSWISRNAPAVSARIEGLWGRERLFQAESVRCLDQISGLSKNFDLGMLEGFVLPQIFSIKLSFKEGNRASSSAAGNLLKLANEHRIVPAVRSESLSASTLLRVWCSDAVDSQDWLEIDVYLTRLSQISDSSGGVAEELRAVFSESVLSFVMAELEDLSSNVDDIEDAERYVNTLSEMVVDYTDGDVSVEAEEAVARVRRKHDDYEPSAAELEFLEESSRSVSGESAEIEAVSHTESPMDSNPIDSLFGQLG